MITFSWVIGMIVEVLISGLTLGQSLQSRITGTVVNLLTGGLYGKFRDRLFRVTKTTEEDRLREMFVGTIGFVVFQMPLYTGILLSTGASLQQVVTSVGTVTAISTVIGGPYDLYLSHLRRLFRVKPSA